MDPWRSRLDPNDAALAQRAAFMNGYLAKVRKVEQRMRDTEAAFLERARKRGKLLPRERLALLLDRGAPFLELCPLAGYQMYGDTDGSLAGGTLIAGLGFVAQRRCLVIVWNYAVKGGTITRVTIEKMLRLQHIALQNRLPIVSLSESGGGNLEGIQGNDPWAASSFIDGGQCYCQQAELSAAGIPQVVVAHGNATAGGAYHVALSDYVVLVREQTQLFLAGPPLLQAATGEVADAESLGGAEMHARTSGTGEYLAENDADAIRLAREIVAQLPRPSTVGNHAGPQHAGPQHAGSQHVAVNGVAGGSPEAHARTAVKPPLYPAETLRHIVPEDPKTFFDIREVFARIADGSRFLEFSAEIDRGTVCAHLQIGGHPVGVIGNNAPITPNGAKKAAQFLQLCDQGALPVVFVHNTTGFLVGVEAEQHGQVKHGSKMIQAVANLRSPKISLVVANSYGAGNYAMASRALKPHFVFAWPTARTAVMGGAQAANVMQIVAETKLARMGATPDAAMQAAIAQQASVIETGLDAISESMYCSARLFDDGIIDPSDSRKVLWLALDTCAEARRATTQPNTFGVARF